MNKEMTTSSVKNQAIAPGLSLVCWVNENPTLVNLISQYRTSLSLQYKNKVIWYDLPHLHITLYSLIRTIYDRIVPLAQADVLPNIEDLVHELASVQSFEISMDKISIENNGEIQITGKTKTEGDLSKYNFIHEAIKKHDPDFKFLAVSDEKKSQNLHCNFGYFAQLPEHGISEKIIALESEIVYTVNIISIVHYMRRTLEDKYMNGYLHLNTSTENSEKIHKESIYQMLGLA